MAMTYICTGGCGGKVSEEEYRAGKTTCATEGCAHHGQPLEERSACDHCGTEVPVEAAHTCPVA